MNMNVGMAMPPHPQVLAAQVQQQQQQQQQQQVQQQQQAQQASQQMLDNMSNISKIKALIGPLRESLTNTIKTAAQTLNTNSQVDAGNLKGVEVQAPRFDKNLEEFYSICDQIELHLKTSIKCLSQAESSNRYLNLTVAVGPTRNENMNINESTLSYSQFLATAGSQVSFTKEIHDTLVAAAQNICPSD
ncbi:mediator of RNA polymerase II transcription subunit 29 [Coccinella septempunctata]|uniref:mediator of RNA polymerase II transcription subunit 29 n=1 Tax=Coccinella septempunctata TaxID=41139 RepID=UPI001D07494C|nr:mediator of RNA polymerase II transcription subunit 29 [Coccinella septempunctata]